jgi:hypothetical protein
MPDFEAIPLVDNHLHPPLTDALAAQRPFAAFFTETHDEQVIVRLVPETRLFRRALRDLAALLDCPPEPEALAAARAALGHARLLRRCVERGNVAALVVDDGYPTPEEALGPAAMAEASGCAVRRILRLESVVRLLVAEHDSLAALDDALVAALNDALAAGTVGLKSVVAYRCGLAFYQPTGAAADAALREAHAALAAGPFRLTSPDLLYHTLAVALAWAGDVGLPVQIHTGFGDRDLFLPKTNPALLRPLLEDAQLNRSPLVLLHASYPFCREAGYLAAMYPNVYVDWSLANPLLAGPELVRVLEQLLALAPVTRLLYGSDAWGIPDWIYLAARYGREALAATLAGDPDADYIARRILHDNAAELYGL